MAEESNWRPDKIVQRVISIPGCEDVTVSETQIVNNRGATLSRLGAGREFQESFLYKDGDVSIQFWALRFDGTEKRIMIDTYSIFLPRPYRIPGSRVPQSTIDRIKQVLRCLAWVVTFSSVQLQVELPGEQVDHGLEVAG